MNKQLECVKCSSSNIDVEEWLDLFEETLEFPFKAKVCEYQERGPLQEGDEVIVRGLEVEDDLYGVIVNLKKGRKKYSFPLVDLEPIGVHRAIKNLFDEYQYWFSNER